MAKVRCNECKKIGDTKDGYCPDCGAIYQEPLNYVSEEEYELYEKQRQIVERHERKKKSDGGFLGFLKKKLMFDEIEKESEKFEEPKETKQEEVQADFDSKPLSERKIRCKECKAVSIGIGDGYCTECGALFVAPYEFADVPINKKQLESNREFLEALSKAKQKEKKFEEMDKEEKIAFLKEEIESLRAQSVTQRHFLTQKSNECMQCFTSAGSIRSNDFDEVLESIIYRRYANLEEFEPAYIEYKRMLDELKETFDKLQRAKEILKELQETTVQ